MGCAYCPSERERVSDVIVRSCWTVPTRNLTSHLRESGYVIFHVVGYVSSHTIHGLVTLSHCGNAQRSSSWLSEAESLGTHRFKTSCEGMVA